MNLRKLLIAGGIATGLVLTATPAHATGPNVKKYDVCDYTGTNSDGSPKFVVRTDLTWAQASQYQGANDIIFDDSNDNIGSGDSSSFRCFVVYGTQGPAGPKGDKGDAGETGAMGPQGPEGPAGPAGEQGPVGDTGPAGQDGTPGLNGADGFDGTDGVDGADADESILTELNNRLFILEHAVPDTEVAGEVVEQPVDAPTGELPRTGSNGTWTLLIIAAGLFAGGSVLRFAVKR